MSGENVEGGERGLRGRSWRCGGGEGNALSRYAAFVPLAILEGGERGQKLFRKKLFITKCGVGLNKEST